MANFIRTLQKYVFPAVQWKLTAFVWNYLQFSKDLTLKKILLYIRFEILYITKNHVMVFGVISLSKLDAGYKEFRETYCIHVLWKWQQNIPLKQLQSTYQITMFHNLNDHDIPVMPLSITVFTNVRRRLQHIYRNFDHDNEKETFFIVAVRIWS